jgi:hypothetical protein
LLLLAGSEAPWHGVDILVNAMSNFRGTVQLRCFIAGSISDNQRENAALVDNVVVLGHQSGQELDRLFDLCHVGVGTLGLSSKFLREACPLKVREYWSRGLPFIVGFQDTDLTGNVQMEPFHLRVEETLNMERVIEWAAQVYSKNDVAANLRSLAYQNIHYQVKARAYVAFFNSLKT